MGSPAVTGYLLDTHVWYWHLQGSGRLPAGLRRLIERAPESCWYSPISVWELGTLVGRGRLELLPDTRTWVADALDALPLHEAPVTLEVALRVPEISLPHRDPADRFLCATALVQDLELVTLDERLVRSGSIPTRSA